MLKTGLAIRWEERRVWFSLKNAFSRVNRNTGEEKGDTWLEAASRRHCRHGDQGLGAAFSDVGYSSVSESKFESYRTFRCL